MILFFWFIVIIALTLLGTRLHFARSAQARQTVCPRCGRPNPNRVTGTKKFVAQMVVGSRAYVAKNLRYSCPRCKNLW